MTFAINGREVGLGHPAYIIAEGCDNHLGDMIAAKEMVRQAKIAGADAIKFQHHLPDEEMLPGGPTSDNFEEPLYDFLKKYALTLDQHIELKKYCDETGITYLCTPFSWAAALELSGAIDVPAYKIGSGEMTDIPSLLRIAGLGQPLIISTGMSTYEEIDRTYEALLPSVSALALLNCVSEYPPEYEDLNIDVLSEMITRYPNAVIGHSDHTPDIYTCFAAVTLGASIIEKHVILDKKQKGPDQSVSIDFGELASLVDGIRKIEASRGSDRSVHGREEAIREWAFRSIVSTQPIPAGAEISQNMVWSKRPGTGIPSHRMPEIIGRTAARYIAANSLLAWDDVEGGEK